ncbi:MAG TPA: adenylate/guanylate cyclase domain-containing protein, partial [Candidatus Dormibacteraeota bacterium]
MTDFAQGLALGRPIVWRDGLQGIAEATDAPFVLPDGTVTFLLTDIEGSTRLWEAHPEAMAQAVPAHYALLSEAIGRHGGVRPVEQGEGDSVVAAFSRASDAVAAALEAQRALSAQVWPEGLRLQVRIALHTAEAQLRDEGNYFGVALSRCARLRAIAHGGQTLLSGAVHDLVVEQLPEGVALADLGTHRLRDLRRPEHVFALS